MTQRKIKYSWDFYKFLIRVKNRKQIYDFHRLQNEEIFYIFVRWIRIRP